MLPDLTPLTSRESVAHGPRPIPCPLDRKVEHVVAWYENADETGRAALRERITPRAASTLSAYAERMASHAVRRGDAAVLRRALLAAAIGWYHEDPRESMLILPLFYDAASRLGIEPEPLFEDAAVAAGLPPDGALASFPQRRPEDCTLACMGYRTGADDDGFRYQRDW
jgi:hypothetical protein